MLSALNRSQNHVIAGKGICVYRVITDNIFVYHIVHGASNYPTRFKRR